MPWVHQILDHKCNNLDRVNNLPLYQIFLNNLIFHPEKNLFLKIQKYSLTNIFPKKVECVP